MLRERRLTLPSQRGESEEKNFRMPSAIHRQLDVVMTVALQDCVVKLNSQRHGPDTYLVSV